MHDHPAHHPFDVDEDQPDNRSLAVYGVAIAFVFFGCGIALTSLFYRAADVVVQERSAGQSQELRSLRSQEDERLSSYGWADKAKGEVRIPIDQAMKLMVEGGKK
jgi:hypothetical protein